MVQITVALPEVRLQELKEVAARLGVSVDTLVRVSVEDLLAKPGESFRKTLDDALKIDGKQRPGRPGGSDRNLRRRR